MEMYAGDSKQFHVSIVDENGAALDISGASFVWTLSGRNKSVTKDSTIQITDAQTGEILIPLESGDTEGWWGVYHYELEMTDADGYISTVLRDQIIIL